MSSYKQLLCEFLLFLQPLIYLSTPTHLGRSQAVLHLTWRALSLSRGQRSKHTHCADFTKAQDQLLPVISCYLWMPAQLTSRSHRNTSDLKEVLKDKKKKKKSEWERQIYYRSAGFIPSTHICPSVIVLQPLAGQGPPAQLGSLPRQAEIAAALGAGQRGEALTLLPPCPRADVTRNAVVSFPQTAPITQCDQRFGSGIVQLRPDTARCRCRSRLRAAPALLCSARRRAPHSGLPPHGHQKEPRSEALTNTSHPREGQRKQTYWAGAEVSRRREIVPLTKMV